MAKRPDLVKTADILFKDKTRHEQRDYEERLDNFRAKCASKGLQGSSYHYKTLIKMERESIEQVFPKWRAAVKQAIEGSRRYPSEKEIEELRLRAFRAIHAMGQRATETLTTYCKIIPWEQSLREVCEAEKLRVDRYLLLMPRLSKEKTRRIGFRQHEEV